MAEVQQPQEHQPELIHTKLGELPVVNDAYTQMMDIYERTKGHNVIFRSYFGMVEYTAKMVAGTAGPRLYGAFQTPIDQANNYACQKLDSLESSYPIITRPTKEVMSETAEKYEQYVEPVARPVLVPAKKVLQAGKTAVEVGAAVATTALKPAVFAVKTGTAVTAAVVNTGKSAVSSVTSTLLTSGEKLVDTGLETAMGEFTLQQVDITLETIEKLMDFYLPIEKESSAGNRKEKVMELSVRVHSAVVARAKGDVVRAQLILGSYLQELMELVGYLVALSKDGKAMATEDVINSVNTLWSKFVDHLPQDMAKTVQSVKERVTTLAVFLVGKVGEMFSQVDLNALLGKENVNNLFSHFTSFCQSSPQFMKSGAEQVMKWAETYLPDLAKYMPTVLEFIHQLLDKAFDSLGAFDLTSMTRRLKVSQLQTEEKIEMEELK